MKCPRQTAMLCRDRRAMLLAWRWGLLAIPERKGGGAVK